MTNGRKIHFFRDFGKSHSSDFTKGKWIDREPIVEGKYCLDKVCIDENTKIY